MLTRDYLLNSITFLNEAVGMLSKEYICSLDDVFKEHIENYEKNIEKYRKI
jgi:hypothetical protein